MKTLSLILLCLLSVGCAKTPQWNRIRPNAGTFLTGKMIIYLISSANAGKGVPKSKCIVGQVYLDEETGDSYICFDTQNTWH